MSQGPFARPVIGRGCRLCWAVVLWAFGCASGLVFLPEADAGAVVGKEAKTGGRAAPIIRKVDFVQEIQPILAERCYSCHGPEKQKADLRWDTKASAFKSGEHGPI